MSVPVPVVVTLKDVREKKGMPLVFAGPKIGQCTQTAPDSLCFPAEIKLTQNIGPILKSELAVKIARKIFADDPINQKWFVDLCKGAKKISCEALIVFWIHFTRINEKVGKLVNEFPFEAIVIYQLYMSHKYQDECCTKHKEWFGLYVKIPVDQKISAMLKQLEQTYINLELELLKLHGWNMFVTEQDFAHALLSFFPKTLKLNSPVGSS
jgi:hypothetical protein